VFLRLPGQWQDETWGVGEPDEGLYHNVHRWYDSGTARYTRPDPLGQQGGPHPYAYAASNPVAFQDPLGLKVELWCARVGAGGNSKIRRSVGKSGASHCFVRVRCDCPQEGGPYDLRLEITGRTGFVNSRGEFPATPPTFHVGNAFASIVPFEPSDWNSNDCTMEQCVLDAYSKS
ncbi:MAG: RHS repeat-associated core domain-containing protein, partial [bacterium]|nr:RHS repeat-associated core domain-containing protein [bacterium]